VALRNRRSALIGAIAVLLAIDLLWVGMTLYAWDTTPQAQCLVPPGPCVIDVRGDIQIDTDTGAGIMNITVSNYANLPLTNITVVAAVPGINGLAVFTPFTVHNAVISYGNQLPIGQGSNGYWTFESGGAPSTTYTVFVRGTLTDGHVLDVKTQIVSDPYIYSPGPSQ
jgi:hypothetical protein